MCGIFYAKSFDGQPVGRVIRRGYYRQKERGTEGFGFVAIRDGEVSLHKAIHEHQIMKDIKHEKDAPELMFHHRFPTSTDNTVQTAHPIVAKSGNIYNNNWYLVHNGCIWNSYTLHAKHKEHGIKYDTAYEALTWVKKYGSSTYDTEELKTFFNDSESLLHELALTLEGKQENNDFDIAGSLAFILLKTDKNNKPISLYFGRNVGSPLKMSLDKIKTKKFFLSSNGPGSDIPVDKLFEYNYATERLSFCDMKFDKYDYSRYHDGVKYLDFDVSENATGTDTESESILGTNDDAPPNTMLEVDLAPLRETNTQTLLDKIANLREELDALAAELNKAQRLENYDKEYKITERRDLLEEYIEAIDKEITRRDMIFG